MRKTKKQKRVAKPETDLTQWGRFLLDSDLEAFQFTDMQKIVLHARMEEKLSYRQITEKYFEGKKSRAAMCDVYQRAKAKALAVAAMERYAENIMECPVDRAPLSPRIRAALNDAGITTLGQLARVTSDRLEAIPGLGPSARFQVRKLLLKLEEAKAGPKREEKARVMSAVSAGAAA
jgi:DNA-directed RNA polymerase alpha subunit